MKVQVVIGLFLAIALFATLAQDVKESQSRNEMSELLNLMLSGNAPSFLSKFREFNNSNMFYRKYNEVIGPSFVHDIFDLYVLSPESVREQIVDFLKVELDSSKLAVDAPIRNSPHIIIKVLLMKEPSLALKMINNSNEMKTVFDIGVVRDVVNRILSIPCDIVPLSKILLHVNSMFLSGAFKSMNPVSSSSSRIRMLAQASKLSFTKSSAPWRDLIDLSPNFNQLFNHSQGLDGKYITVEGVVEVLSDISNELLLSLLNRFASSLDDSDDFMVLRSLHRISNVFVSDTMDADRLPWHYLAASGCASCVKTLQTFLSNSFFSSKINDRMRFSDPMFFSSLESMKKEIKDSLLHAKDKRGLSAGDILTIRWGTNSSIGVEWAKWEMIVGDISTSKESLEATLSVDIHQEISSASSSSLTDTAVSMDGAVIKSINSLPLPDDHNGGWKQEHLSIFDSSAALDSWKDRSYCDIKEVMGPLPDWKEFYDQYVRTGTPVVFRQALNESSSFRQLMMKDQFLSRYGNEKISYAAIPYARTFGLSSSGHRMEDVIKMQDMAFQELQKAPQTQDHSIPLYAFSVADPSWKSKLYDDVGLPYNLRDMPRLTSSSSAAVSSSSSAAASPSSLQPDNVEIQFYLGPSGSGAPAHIHGHAVNSVAFGEKLWMLFPPSQAFYSTEPSLRFAQDTRFSHALRCTQFGGDVFYVPTLWGHATLNRKQCIGVAHEFSVEEFCME